MSSSSPSLTRDTDTGRTAQRLTGRVAVVTGASSGIGAAAARRPPPAARRLADVGPRSPSSAVMQSVCEPWPTNSAPRPPRPSSR
ncbi:hypothetical protein [Streptomyces noursei]|uniref:hypothetical protein n=1 Tax=Streptomyces noursei TaxID=1971 RepID=UPI0038222507